MALPALRLAVGTLTVIPVGALGEITPPVAARAMIIAPVATLPLGVMAAAVAGLAWVAGLPALVIGLLVVGAVALGTRAMHLDGLADTADGLGSGWNRERALMIMKRGDVGPMGVVTLIIVLGVQAAALGQLVDGLRGALLTGLLIVVSRAALVLVCRRGVPAARPTGLGVAVAGTVPRTAAVLSWLLVAGVVAAAYEVLGREPWWLGVVAAALAGLVVLGLVRHCVRRFGGVTGDVMGAAVELAFTILLLVAAAQ